MSPIPQSIIGYVGKLVEIKRYAKSARDLKRLTAILNVKSLSLEFFRQDCSLAEKNYENSDLLRIGIQKNKNSTSNIISLLSKSQKKREGNANTLGWALAETLCLGKINGFIFIVYLYL